MRILTAVLVLLIPSLVVAQETPSGQHKQTGQQKQPKAEAKKDPYAGKTVKDGRTGMGLANYREKRAPKAGQVAPPLKLKRADGKGMIDLASFKGKSDVVLVFGSYT